MARNYKNSISSIWRYLIGGDDLEVVELKSGLKFRIWRRQGHTILRENLNAQHYVRENISFDSADVVIDIGAHIGTFTVSMANRFPQVTILCFEALKKNFDILSDNVALNGLQTRVKSFNTAVMSTEGTMQIYVSEMNTGGSSLKTKVSEKSSIVQTTNLKQVFESNGISQCALLKIDAEGSEYDILMNTDTATLSKIRRIALEYEPLGELDGKDLATFLTKNGFKVKLEPGKIRGGLLFAVRDGK